MTALDVYLHSAHVGRLERLDGARLEFAYAPGWIDGGEPLSLCLPLREEPFSDPECRPFFAGLLPEGEFLKAVARALGVSAGNPFSVLERGSHRSTTCSRPVSTEVDTGARWR